MDNPSVEETHKTGLFPFYVPRAEITLSDFPHFQSQRVLIWYFHKEKTGEIATCLTVFKMCNYLIWQLILSSFGRKSLRQPLIVVSPFFRFTLDQIIYEGSPRFLPGDRP